MDEKIISKDKVMKAAKRYLNLYGYDFLGKTSNGFLVCQNEDDLVLVNVCWACNAPEFPESDVETLRHEFETAMLEWVRKYPDDADYKVSCDEIQFNIIREDRSLVRHCVNAIERSW